MNETPRNIIALIPARGGSKGIPRKNLRMMAGKPLLAYTIEQALRAPSISRVIVSTDDAEIKAVAQHYGAEVIDRPAAISGDAATSESALLHGLDTLREAEGYEPDLVVFLQATSPLRQPDDIEQAIATLYREDADSLLSGCSVHGLVWRSSQDALSSLSYDYRNRQRRQDSPHDFMENGSIYLFKPWVLREHNNRLGGRIALYRMHPLDSFQIDEPDDIDLIERLMAVQRPAAPDVLFAHIDLLVLDFDGVLTDNRVLVHQDGTEAVWCHRGDGWGIARLREAGIEVMVISTEENPVVAARCRKLNIPCVHGVNDKLSVLRKLAQDRGLAAGRIAYVGNDVNDLSCLQWVGLPCVVADAMPEVKRVARYITTKRGGEGAVREVADCILRTKATISLATNPL